MTIDIEEIKKRRKEEEAAIKQAIEGLKKEIENYTDQKNAEIAELEALLGTTEKDKHKKADKWTAHMRIYRHPDKQKHTIWWNGKGTPGKVFLKAFKSEGATLKGWLNQDLKHIYDKDKEIIKKMKQAWLDGLD